MRSAEIKILKAKAHTLKPVVIIGQAGLTEAVINETEIALEKHELIKVKIRAEREERKLIRNRICAETEAELIQSIGQVAIFYKENRDK